MACDPRLLDLSSALLPPSVTAQFVEMSVRRGGERARCMNQARNRSPNLWEPTTRVQNNQNNQQARTARVFVVSVYRGRSLETPWTAGAA